MAVKPFLLALLLAGCASPRYLTQAEDASLRETCEKDGCTLVPTPLWDEIKAILKGGTRI